MTAPASTAKKNRKARWQQGLPNQRRYIVSMTSRSLLFQEPALRRSRAQTLVQAPKQALAHLRNLQMSNPSGWPSVAPRTDRAEKGRGVRKANLAVRVYRRHPSRSHHVRHNHRLRWKKHRRRAQMTTEASQSWPPRRPHLQRPSQGSRSAPGSRCDRGLVWVAILGPYWTRWAVRSGVVYLASRPPPAARCFPYLPI